MNSNKLPNRRISEAPERLEAAGHRLQMQLVRQTKNRNPARCLDRMVFRLPRTNDRIAWTIVRA